MPAYHFSTIAFTTLLACSNLQASGEAPASFDIGLDRTVVDPDTDAHPDTDVNADSEQISRSTPGHKNLSTAIPDDARPPSEPAPQDVHKDFCLVTHHTQNAYNYAQIAIDSQQHYAQRHNYGHKAFLGRITGDQFIDSKRGDINNLWGGGLFWQKLAAVRQVLQEGIEQDEGTTLRCDWVMWLDSDAVITNETISLQDIVARYAASRGVSATHGSVDIILSAEDDHPVNAGVFFVHNTLVGRGFIDAVLALYPLYKDNALPEQTAIGTLAYTAEPWPSNTAARGTGAYLHPSFAIAPQRTFNSFQGVGRRFPQTAQWQPCDFVAHFAGTPWHLRERAMLDVLQDIARCEP